MQASFLSYLMQASFLSYLMQASFYLIYRCSIIITVHVYI